MSNQWEELIKEVRKTESEVELKLVSFSKLGSSYALSIQPQEQNSLGTSDSSTIFQISHSMSVEIEQLLANFAELNTQLARTASTSGNPTFTNIVHSHQSNLRDYVKEFRSVKAKITSVHNQVELFVGSRNSNQLGDGDDRMDTLLRERASLHSIDNHADNFLSHGNAVHSSIRGQKNLLSNTHGNLRQTKGTFSAIDRIYAAIQRKRTRDCIILSSFTGILICFLLYWWLTS